MSLSARGRLFGAAFLAAFMTAGLFSGSLAADTKKEKFTVVWSHYTGWEPWACINSSGIMKRWADKYNVDIKIVLVSDYVESINQFTSGAVDGVTVTNMDALALPGVGGKDTTVVVFIDFSNGNDGIVITGGNSVADLKGREVRLAEFSVSHYLLASALSKNGMTERDMTLKNTSESEMSTVFAEAGENAAVVTWNPSLMVVRNMPGARMVFDSSQIPGEIIDMLVVRTDAPESLKRALAGAWYEYMSVMTSRGASGRKALQCMAASAGGTEDQFVQQLKTTAMFYTPDEAAAFARSDELKKTMDFVRTFLFEHGLYERASSADAVGIEFPDGSIMGNPGNVKLRFSAEYMDLAAGGKL